MYSLILILHIVAATIWTGGHLVLAVTVLPRALKQRTVEELSVFESGYERIGIPALLVQFITGLWLAYQFVPDVSQWLNLHTPAARLICIKLSLLVITVILAIDARLRVIPNLTEANLNSLAFHIVPVTVISVLFVVVGVSFRTGWLF